MEILLTISLIANLIMAIKKTKKPDIIIKDVPFNACDKSSDIMEVRFCDEDVARLFSGNGKCEFKQYKGGMDVKITFNA